MAEGEKTSIGKFVKGFFLPQNHLKVVVFIGICGIWFCIWTTAKTYLQYKTQKPNTINSGGGAVDNSTKRTFWSFLEVNFGGQNK